MGADVIPVSFVQSSGLRLSGYAYEALSRLGAVAYDANKPYFIFDVRVADVDRQRVLEGLSVELNEQDAAALSSFLESMDWEASFVFLG